MSYKPSGLPKMLQTCWREDGEHGHGEHRGGERGGGKRAIAGQAAVSRRRRGVRYACGVLGSEAEPSCGNVVWVCWLDVALKMDISRKVRLQSVQTGRATGGYGLFACSMHILIYSAPMSLL
jgi:hypothetical protein